MFIDPIADLIIKIKNANQAKLAKIEINSSNFTTAILKILLQEGYIEGYATSSPKLSKIKKTVVTLKFKESVPSITGIRQISKPGLRVYQESKNLPRVLNGLGIAIISTSKGVLTDKQARKENLGGEIIAYVW